MIKRSHMAFAALSLLALSACGDTAGGGGSRESIRAVGSSTVFPFAKLVSESFVRSNPEFPSPIIEATGSGGGRRFPGISGVPCGGGGVTDGGATTNVRSMSICSAA